MSNLTLLEENKSFGGWQRKYQHDSETLSCQMKFEIYIPETDEPTPIIWALAGLSSTEENFSQKSGLQRLASKHGIVFVMPDTSPRGEEVPEGDHWDIGSGAGFYLNATEEPWEKHYHMYDYLTKELPQIIYELVPNYSGQEAILGHSMGGYGALQIGIKNSERFQSISAFAPITNPTKVPWGIKAFTTYLGDNRETWSEWDTVKLIQQTDDAPPIFITQGTSDEFYEEHLDATKFLEAGKNKDISYQEVDGYPHNYYFVSTFLEEHVNFHLKNFK